MSFIMLSVIMLSVIMLSVFMLSVFMLSVFMVNVIMLNVVAPKRCKSLRFGEDYNKTLFSWIEEKKLDEIEKLENYFFGQATRVEGLPREY